MHWKFGIGSMLVAALTALPFIAGAQDSKSEKQDLIKRQLAMVREEQAEISKSLLKLIDEHGTLVMSRDRILEELTQLEDDGWNSRVEREQMSIRSEVLRDRLKVMVSAAKEGEAKDEVGSLLEKKLALANSKKNRIEALLKSGTAPSSELEEAESLVTDAQLALAQHREQRKQSPEAEEIKSVSRELADMESDVIVKEKTALICMKRSDELKKSLLKTSDYSDLERTEQSLTRRREHWEQKLLDLETEEFEAPPKVGKKE